MGAPATRWTIDIPSRRRPLGVQLLPWFYHGNSYWRDRANRNRPIVEERTLRHRSNELCRAVWRPHWPFMQKHLVRPRFATGFQKVPFGRRTMKYVRDVAERLIMKELATPLSTSCRCEVGIAPAAAGLINSTSALSNMRAPPAVKATSQRLATSQHLATCR